MGAGDDREGVLGFAALPGCIYVRRGVLWLILGLSSLLAGLAACLAAAAAVRQPTVFLIAGCVTATAIWLLGVAGVRRRHAAKAAPRGGVVASVLAAVALGALVAGLLVPLGDPREEPAAPPGAGQWTLTDGTRLAYGVIHTNPSAGRAALPPVVVLHGGPGVPDLAGMLTALRPLAAAGHDVYAYAQLGAGSSSRLSNPSGYTVQRAVADLEQIRRQISAPRILVLGHSYGGYLAAAYLTAHPDRVAGVVFSSPGDLRDGLSGAALQSRLSLREKLATYRLLVRPRALLAYGLTQVDPASAHAFAGDAELDARMDRVYAATEPATHCPGVRGPVLHGLGFYANQVPQSATAPPAPVLRQALRGIDVSALVITGECDYLPRSASDGYLQVLPQSQVVRLQGAGHDAYFDRPTAYADAVKTFLHGIDSR